MHRRHTTKSKPGLHHRKSTSSVHTVQLDHLDPVVAHRDAQIAANEAFCRARFRDRKDPTLFPPPSLPPSPAHRRKENQFEDVMRTDGGKGNTHGVTRQRSVRFVNRAPLGEEIAAIKRETRGSVEGGSESSQTSPRRARRSSSSRCSLPPQPSPKQIKSRLASHDKNPVVEAPSREPPPVPHPAVTPSHYLESLLGGGESYTPEDDIASQPSSYRRIRRARSVITPSHFGRHHQASSTDPVGARTRGSSPTLRRSSPDKEEVCPQGPQPSLNAPKSMSFLKIRDHKSMPSDSLRGQDGACSPVVVHTTGRSHATHSYPGHSHPGHSAPSHSLPGHLHPHSLNSKPSMFFGSATQRPVFSLKRSLRSSSNSSTAPPPAVLSSDPGDIETKSKLRKTSQSLKSKIKKLFSKSKSDGDTSFPEQHIESHKTHAFFSNGLQAGNDEGSVSNVPCTTPSIHTGGPHESHQSRRASLETVDAESQYKVSDERSRVTSWTNSASNTLTSQQRQTWNDWAKPLHLPAIEEGDGRATTPPGPAIDSQRIYSALMKRLHETNQLPPGLREQWKASCGNDEPSDYPTNSYDCASASSVPFTVRHVTSDQAVREVGVQEGSQPLVEAEERGTAPYQEYPNPTTRDGAVGTQETLNPEAYSQEIQEPRSGTLSDRRSAFFGSPSTHLFRTVSPYRRALRQSMEAADGEVRNDNPAALEPDLSETATLIRRAVPLEVPVGEDEVAYTESVYSDTVSEAGSDGSRGTMPRASCTNPPVTYQPTNYRQANSSVSSVDWKAWLSNSAAKQDISPPRSHEVEYTLPTMPLLFGRGHVREGAQIDDENERDEIGSVGRLSRRPSALPSSPLAAVEPNVVNKMPINKMSPAQGSARVVAPRPAGKMTENENPRHAEDQPSTLSDKNGPRAISVPIGDGSGCTDSARPVMLKSRAGGTKESGKKEAEQGERASPMPPTRRLRATKSASRSPMAAGQPSARLLRRARRGGGGFAQSSSTAFSTTTSPGLGAAVERQFGTSEEAQEGESRARADDIFYDGGNSPAGGSLGQFEQGGKKMVDLFLSSRRQRMVSGREGGAFV